MNRIILVDNDGRETLLDTAMKGPTMPTEPTPAPRTVATVATELENAIKMHAALPERIKSLRAELDALLGKKTRGPRKTGA